MARPPTLSAMHNHHITRAIAEAHAADLQCTAARNRPTASVAPRLRRRAIVAALIAVCALAPSTRANARIPDQDLRNPDNRVVEAARASNQHYSSRTITSEPAQGLTPPTTEQSPQDLRSPDARDAARTGSLVATTSVAGQDLRSPDARDAAAGRGTFSAPQVAVVKLPQPMPVSSDAIDWGDVGIGAGGVLCLALLALGATLAITHRRQRARPTATTG